MTFLFGLLCVGLLLAAHEAGHALVGGRLGAEVKVFSLGFGRSVGSFLFRTIRFRVCWLFLGGFVQFAEEGPGSLQQLSWPRRVAIALAGPLANLFLSVLFLTLAYLVGPLIPTYQLQPVQLGRVVDGSQLDRHGIQAGDRLVRAGGVNDPCWSEVDRLLSGPLPIELAFQHSSVTVTTPGTTLQSLGALPFLPARIGGLVTGGPAQHANLPVGSDVISVDGKPVRSWHELLASVEQRPARNIRMQIATTDGHLSLINISPELKDGRPFLGVYPDLGLRRTPSDLPSAVALSLERALRMAELTFMVVRKALAGTLSSGDIGGPLAIIKFAGEALSLDIFKALTILAFLSLQLAFLNLLPLPVLDGGHILFSCWEGISGAPASQTFQRRAQAVGAFLIVFLMFWALFNDLLQMLA